MSFSSWFFHKPSSSHTLPNKTSGAAFAVRTMRDDIKNAGSGISEPLQSQDFETLRQTPINFSQENTAPAKLLNQKEETGEPQSPFGITSAVTPKRSPSTYSARSITEKGLPSAALEGNILINQQSQSHKMLWIGVFAVVFLLAGILGAWRFLLDGKIPFNYKEKTLEPPSASNTMEKVSEIQKTPEENSAPVPQPFSSDKPNYLSFDTETVSPEDIRATLSQVAERIKKSNLTKPIEFLVTDQNNNPLAFSRFALLLKLELDSKILALTQETFSLYAYNDAGWVRFGLVLNFKDTDTQTATDAVKETESKLPYALRAFTLEPNINIEKKLALQSSHYNGLDIRFINFDIDNKISLDYAFYANRLIIGTSKNTLRAIFDYNVKTH